MDAYTPAIIGAAAAIVVMLCGWGFVKWNRRQDFQRGGDKEVKDSERATREKLATQLDEERKATARNVETDRKDETARVESERKNAAADVEAEQRRIVQRVDDLERSILTAVGDLKTDLAVLTERISSSSWMRLQTEMSKSLHHPEPEFAEADALLKELDAGTLTPERRMRLKELMTERESDMRVSISELERRTAAVIHIAMDQVEKEEGAFD